MPHTPLHPIVTTPPTPTASERHAHGLRALGQLHSHLGSLYVAIARQQDVLTRLDAVDACAGPVVASQADRLSRRATAEAHLAVWLPEAARMECEIAAWGLLAPAQPTTQPATQPAQPTQEG